MKRVVGVAILRSATRLAGDGRTSRDEIVRLSQLLAAKDYTFAITSITALVRIR
ncbi:MAG: hypothetical protein HYX75_21150 [Acidobacteria bacterium]|nr:hypothetical protein [Acidobacteriota bacterium]